MFVNPRLICSFLRVSLAFPQGFGHFLNFMFFLPVSPSKFQVEDGAELKEQMRERFQQSFVCMELDAEVMRQMSRGEPESSFTDLAIRVKLGSKVTESLWQAFKK